MKLEIEELLDKFGRFIDEICFEYMAQEDGNGYAERMEGK